jgi:hypothetical protein
MATDGLPDRLELFEKLHFHELEVRERVTSRLQHSLSVLIVLTGVVVYVMRDAHLGSNGNANAGFVSFLGGAAIGCVVMAIFVVKGLWNPEYREVYTAETIAKKLDEYVATYAPYDAEHGTNALAEETEKFMRDMYMQSATANAQVNDYRATQAHNANGVAIATAICVALAFLVMVFGGIDKGGPAAVEVTKPVAVDVLSLPAQGTAPSAQQPASGQGNSGAKP